MRACSDRQAVLAGILAAAACVALPVGALAAERACESLAGLAVAGATLESATELRDAVPGELLGRRQGFALAGRACRVTGLARPAPTSRVRFEVWIPLDAKWNARYLQLGTGGFAGRMPYHDVAAPLARGYAVGVTDGGHTGSGYTDASFALEGDDAILDFGRRAQKSTRDAALAVLAAWSGSEPRRAYFAGCSNGGREALTFAQRYPSDFDGIVAGAPANYMTGLFEYFATISRRLAEPGHEQLRAKLPLLERAVRSSCGRGTDHVPDPAACDFEPGALACPAARASAACLTRVEVATLRAIAAGFRDATTGARIRGPSPGAEAAPGGWGDWIVGGSGPDEQAAGREFARSFYAFFVRREPQFDLADLTRRDVRAGRRYARMLDASDPDLRAFAAAGGRLLQYHGWNDAGIPADSSIRYHREVRRKVGDTSAFHRLYLVPGMLHCGGGPAPSTVDWLGALDEWVERGVAPGELVATGVNEDGAVTTQRLRPYSP